MSATYRVGMIVPSSNTTMETELPAVLRARERERPQETFTLHSARVRMKHVTAEELRAMNAQTERAVAELPDGAREIVILHYIEGYPCAEIAERLGIVEGTVKSQLHRARKLLKEALT